MPYTHKPDKPMNPDHVQQNTEAFLSAVDDLNNADLQSRMDWMVNKLAFVLIEKGMVKTFDSARNAAALFFAQCVAKGVKAKA